MTQTSARSAIELDEAYRNSTFDALLPKDLLADEVAQRRESGYDVDDVVRAANATDPEDHAAALALVDRMGDGRRLPGWEYEEPESLEDIRAAVASSPAVAVDTNGY